MKYNPVGELLNECNSLLFFVPFVIFVDELRFFDDGK